jgi:uncharacterized protein with GYD domain
LIQEDGSKRRDAVKQMVEKAGGKLLSFHFALGSDDAVGVVEFPGVASAAAMSMAVNSSGAVTLHTTLLLSPEDVDAAAKKGIAHRAPGS